MRIKHFLSQDDIVRTRETYLTYFGKAVKWLLTEKKNDGPSSDRRSTSGAKAHSRFSCTAKVLKRASTLNEFSDSVKG